MAVFHAPTKIYTGTNALDVLGNLAVQRAFLVTDATLRGCGLADIVAQKVTGAKVTIFDHVTPDPPTELVAEGAALCQRVKPQLLLALGGGSVMDCAKGIFLAFGQKIPFFAIPTTSGSGSEVTSFAILTHQGVKEPLIDPAVRPECAILDPIVLEKLPQGLIADSGMDLLAHCVEALGATGRTGFTDALAMHGARTVLSQLADSFQGDRSCRLQLHEASTMAAMAFDNAGLGICHALAHAMGGALHLPHGRLCAMLLPGVMRCNAPQALAQYAALARCCGLAGQTDNLALRQLLAAIRGLRRQLKLPENLMQAGIDRSRWMEVRQQVLQAALEDPCCRTNPVAVTGALLEQALEEVEKSWKHF